MPLFPRAKQDPHAPMTASAKRMDAVRLLSPEAFKKRGKDWQERVLRFSDMIPEVSSAGKFIENSIGRVQWEASEDTPEGPRDSTNQLVNDLTYSLRTLDAGRLARMLFTIGEGYLVVTPAEVVKNRPAYEWWNPTGESYFWRSVSISELDQQDGRLAIRQNAHQRDNLQALLPGQEIYRVWSPDQRYAQEAWSSHRSMLDILEAMVLHTIADKIFALSVVANSGILYIPNDDFLPEPYDSTGPALPGTARAFDEIMNEAARLAMTDNSGTESITPVKMYGRADHAKGLKHLLMDRQDNADAYAARMDAYRNRYATGVDLPAEVVTGIADSNHWSSWKVDQNTWTYHLAPMACMIAESIVEAWLIPKLVQAGVPDPTKYCIYPNGRNVVSKPDNTPTILRLLELGAITPDKALNALDMPVDWANTEYDSGSAEYEQPKSDTNESPTRTNPDEAPATKAASAAPAWFNKVGKIEDGLYFNILEEMRRASTTAVTMSAKTGDASQSQQANQEVEATGIAAIVFALLQKAAADRFSQADREKAESLLAEYLRSRTADLEKASQYAARYVADLLAGRMHRQGLSDPDGTAIPSDYVPPVAALSVMSIAAGGDPADFDPSMLKSDTPVRNWNADPIWLEAVARETGMRLGLEFIWERGHPKHPFPEHVELGGLTWREGDISPVDPWFPGDHHGCQCRIIARPYIPQ